MKPEMATMQDHRLPSEFTSRMRENLGSDYDDFIKSYDDPPVRAMLLNSLRGIDGSALPFDLSEGKVPWELDGYYIKRADSVGSSGGSGESAGSETESKDRPGKHVLHEAGAYYIQEPSAMAPARALFSDLGKSGFASGMAGEPHVLDLCAAPGGKSVQLAMMMKGRGLLISNEIVSKRAQTLSRNIERMGITNAVVTNESPERLASVLPAFFDRILVDAPCSGEGMFRKNPEAMSEWSLEAVERCAKRQDEILDSAADMLTPGGRLVYSTCTWADKEDEGAVARFHKRHGDFKLLKQEKLYPHIIKGEGQFYALLEREGSVSSRIVDISGSALFCDKTSKNTRNNIKKLTDELSELLEITLSDPGSFLKSLGYDRLRPETLRVNNDAIFLLHCQYCGELSALRILRPGLHIANIKKDRLEPAHSLSHALRPEDARVSCELDETGAKAYINGEMITPPDFDKECAYSRYALVTYRRISLGWGRLSGGKIKNLYPKGLRLKL